MHSSAATRAPEAEDPGRFNQATEEVTVPSLAVSETPILRIGMADGPDPYLFSRVEGAARLPDGRIVVAVQGMHEIRAFSQRGEHLWSAGRRGQGPGEFRSVQLPGQCTRQGTIVAYDARNDMATVFNEEGTVMATYGIAVHPFGYAISCAPGGRLVFSDFGDAHRPGGATFRWRSSLAFADPPYAAVEVFRRDFAGPERFQFLEDGTPTLSGPRPWGRDLHFAATDEGVWAGTADEYEIEFVAWTGATTRRIRWAGPALEVTREDRDRYRASLQSRYRLTGAEDWRAHAAGRWDEEEPLLPSVFPTIARILVPRGGGVWVEHYRRPGAGREWLIFDEDGSRVGNLSLPVRMLVTDVGPDWVLVRHTTDDLNVEYIELYNIVTVD